MSIKEITEKYNFSLTDDMKEKYEKIIISLFNDDIIPELDDPVVINICGVYYERKLLDHNLAKKCYLKAANSRNICVASSAMNNLATLYENSERNYELAKKYYLTAIDGGNAIAMCNLGMYYKYREKNYDLMKKYYLMAVEKNIECLDEIKFNGGFNDRFDHDINVMEIFLMYPEKCLGSIAVFVSTYNKSALTARQITKYGNRFKIIDIDCHILSNRKLVTPFLIKFKPDVAILCY